MTVKDPEQIIDTWLSAVTGIGTSRDKLISYEIDPGRAPMDHTKLAGLYAYDPMARRYVTQIPFESVRNGYVIKTDDDQGDEGRAIFDWLWDMGALQKTIESWNWGRAFGAGALYMIADDGLEESEALNVDGISQVIGFRSLESCDLVPVKWYEDPSQDNYGEVEAFQLQPRTKGRASAPTVEIHETRLIQFHGDNASWQILQQVEGNWGKLSVLEAPYAALRAFNAAWSSAGHLMTDANQGVFKVKNLMKLLNASQTGGSELVKRMVLNDQMRSVARAVMVDADMEDFERQPHNLGGLENILREFGVFLSAAFGMPVTVLMGTSPAGLNATGESDLELWHARIEAEREQNLTPALDRLIEVATAAPNGPTSGDVPETWSIEYAALSSPDEKTKAETRKLNMEAVSIGHESGVVEDDEFRQYVAEKYQGLIDAT